MPGRTRVLANGEGALVHPFRLLEPSLPGVEDPEVIEDGAFLGGIGPRCPVVKLQRSKIMTFGRVAASIPAMDEGDSVEHRTKVRWWDGAQCLRRRDCPVEERKRLRVSLPSVGEQSESTRQPVNQLVIEWLSSFRNVERFAQAGAGLCHLPLLIVNLRKSLVSFGERRVVLLKSAPGNAERGLAEPEGFTEATAGLQHFQFIAENSPKIFVTLHLYQPSLS